MSDRVQKILAHLGWGSRRRCEELVREGRVTLGGVALSLGSCLEEHEIACLMVDGVSVGGVPLKRYILLNKPQGYVTTVSDPQGRPTVMELLPKDYLVGPKRLYPVGRLDRDTEGALLLTNDGELAHRLLHPSLGVHKEYRAKVASFVSEDILDELRLGPMLADGPSQPPVLVESRGKEVIITLNEGRKHQVKRMLKAVGLSCRYLERRKFAHLTLHGLKRGSYRDLAPDEVRYLYGLVDLTL